MEAQKIDPSRVETYYIDLIFPMIGNLYAEALIIGVFVVGFGMLRQPLRNPAFLKEHSFYQRACLLFVVMIWTANLHASYGLYRRQFNRAENPLSAAEAHVLSDLTRVMIPLEISATITTALMFGAIAFRDYARGAHRPGHLKREIRLLFQLAAVTHFIFFLWFWVVYGMTDRITSLTTVFSSSSGAAGWDSSPAMQPVGLNMAFHLGVAAIYGIASLVWRIVSYDERYEPNCRAWDWAGVVSFCFIMFNVYWLRLGQYIDNMGSAAP